MTTKLVARGNTQKAMPLKAKPQSKTSMLSESDIPKPELLELDQLYDEYPDIS